MDVLALIEQFNAYQRGEAKGLTKDEAQFLCENEEHEAFMFDFSLYTDIMDYRDHLEYELD